MDWLKWLSSSNLDPALVHQYGVLFTKNELQEDDIPFFNHEFLQSMGIKIAKHRLEILKLLTPPSTKQKSSSKVLVAAKRTKKSFTKYMLKPWANMRKEDQSQNNTLAIVPVYDDTTGKIDYDHHGSRLSRGLTLLKRSSQRRVQAPNKSATTTPDSYYSYKKHHQQSKRHNFKVVNTINGRSGSPIYGNGNITPRIGSFSSSPFRTDCLMMVDRMNGHDDHGYVDDLDFDDGYWSAGVEETKWDSMFHNLKPT